MQQRSQLGPCDCCSGTGRITSCSSTRSRQSESYDYCCGRGTNTHTLCSDGQTGHSEANTLTVLAKAAEPDIQIIRGYTCSSKYAIAVLVEAAIRYAQMLAGPQYTSAVLAGAVVSHPHNPLAVPMECLVAAGPQHAPTVLFEAEGIHHGHMATG